MSGVHRSTAMNSDDSDESKNVIGFRLYGCMGECDISLGRTRRKNRTEVG